MVAVSVVVAGVPVRAGEPSGLGAEARTQGVDELLRQLASAEDEAAAAAIRARLQALWMTSGSVTADLLNVRAVQALRSGESGLALDLLDAAIVAAPPWPGGRHGRALLHIGRGELRAAVGDLEAALSLEPRHLPSLSALAALHEASAHKAEALKLLRRAAALDPRDELLARRVETLTVEVEGREL